MMGRPRHGTTRIVLALVTAVCASAGIAVPPASSAQAAAARTCINASRVPVTCPTIVSVTVGSAWVRSSVTTPLSYSVTVVVDDPAHIALEMETYLGRGLSSWPPEVLAGYGIITSPASVSGIRKTFTATVTSPYRPLYPAGASPAYGIFQINPAVMGLDPDAVGSIDPNNQLLTNTWRSGSIKARSVLTNTPSATSVRRGQLFTERGRLTRFDGTPLARQRVTVYYVPAGQTRASYAGTATTTSTGAWSLAVRSWYTGTRFVSYPGSTVSTAASRGVLVRVS